MGTIDILIFIGLYFVLLGIISYLTQRGNFSELKSFFIAEKKAPWALVAYGMIGTALSGVTFISVPGMVYKSKMHYFQIVIGYFIGYLLIAYVLLPIYYKHKLISIYGYLENTLGKTARKIASYLFIISRLLGAGARLYLSTIVLQFLVFDKLGIPIEVTTIITILFIYVYTFKTGLKTIIWTDFLQTTFMLAALCATIFYILNESPDLTLESVLTSKYAEVFEWDYKSSDFVLKHLLTGILIAFTMTGLDQDQMQKNLSISNLKDARKNVITYGFAIVVVNFFFLLLGVLLIMYAREYNIKLPEKTDQIFPMLATQYFSYFIAILFIIGLIAATYSSADGSITALTTSFALDILRISPEDDKNINLKRKLHLMFSGLTILTVLGLYYVEKWTSGNWNTINIVLRLGAYTYGPLLALFLFPMFYPNIKVNNMYLIIGVLLAPLVCFILDVYDTELFNGYQIGHELILINAVITFIVLYLGKER